MVIFLDKGLRSHIVYFFASRQTNRVGILRNVILF